MNFLAYEMSQSSKKRSHLIKKVLFFHPTKNMRTVKPINLLSIFSSWLIIWFVNCQKNCEKLPIMTFQSNIRGDWEVYLTASFK